MEEGEINSTEELRVGRDSFIGRERLAQKEGEISSDEGEISSEGERDQLRGGRG